MSAVGSFAPPALKPATSRIRRAAPPDSAIAALVATDQSAKKTPVRCSPLSAVSASTTSAWIAAGSDRSAPSARPVEAEIRANQSRSPSPSSAAGAKSRLAQIIAQPQARCLERRRASQLQSGMPSTAQRK